jgi:drug/metabolite transporter (DMT)-like permease
MTPEPLNMVHIWTSIVLVAVFAVTGDVLTARAMRRVGDLDEIRARSGMPGAIKAVLTVPEFPLGVAAMTLSFFSLLYALAPPAPVSLIAPATASLTYIGNAIVARTFLRENVDRRRWVSVLLVTVGIYLITK